MRQVDAKKPLEGKVLVYHVKGGADGPEGLGEAPVAMTRASPTSSLKRRTIPSTKAA